MTHSSKVIPFLLDNHLVDSFSFNTAESFHKQQLMQNPSLLVSLGLISEQQMVSAYVKSHGIEKCDIKTLPSEAPSHEIATRFLQEAECLPVFIDEAELTLAMVNPEDSFACRSIAQLTKKRVKRLVITQSEFKQLYHQWHAEQQDKRVAHSDRTLTDADDDSSLVNRLKDMASQEPVVKLVNSLLNKAVELNASDIHIEPFEHHLAVRYRMDGVLKQLDSPPVKSSAAVISRIKIMAELNIAERRLPQDGRLQIHADGRLIDCRVSTTPTLHGESIVIRLLDKQKVTLDIQQLGLSPQSLNGLIKQIKQPHGIILVTGPTGSGKTTTLYSALQQLNTEEKKILTVEDPIEYQLTGINQIQVKPRIGLGFAEALRALVRQDPDVLMIGEMRDKETASIAIQSALTGHLVFSTLHTNDASSAVTRCLDMGLEHYLLAASLNAVMAQRLVRRLCLSCREQMPINESTWGTLIPDSIPFDDKARFYRAVGCDACQNSGYHGRTMISELLIMTDAIRQLILQKADAKTIEQKAIEQGMQTLKQDGFRLVLAGMTSVDEVLRLTQSDHTHD
ncbi:general secretion pathway protein E [Methylophaga aminisulfidivorans MP]|uniref:General secretion pathway protein E n=2 Tax=Methylophaga TaxID=40222 RepID=F5SUX6_9GAMM|nr:MULTISPECIES: ATPase, T2SS/T4P/T4SS family [Methylophaga]EGL55563.1 general secretion pathway protein E [Methylophaga aminisulfidivorans MP]GLP98838.1 type II secretion system protein E [Methylophaga thalassica]